MVALVDLCLSLRLQWYNLRNRTSAAMREHSCDCGISVLNYSQSWVSSLTLTYPTLDNLCLQEN